MRDLGPSEIGPVKQKRVSPGKLRWPWAFHQVKQRKRFNPAGGVKIEGLRDLGIEDNASMYTRQNGDKAKRIVQGKNGFLVPVRNVEALAEAMGV